MMMDYRTTSLGYGGSIQTSENDYDGEDDDDDEIGHLDAAEDGEFEE